MDDVGSPSSQTATSVRAWASGVFVCLVQSKEDRALDDPGSRLGRGRLAWRARAAGSRLATGAAGASLLLERMAQAYERTRIEVGTARGGASDRKLVVRKWWSSFRGSLLVGLAC